MSVIIAKVVVDCCACGFGLSCLRLFVGVECVASWNLLCGFDLLFVCLIVTTFCDFGFGCCLLCRLCLLILVIVEVCYIIIYLVFAVL